MACDFLPACVFQDNSPRSVLRRLPRYQRVGPPLPVSPVHQLRLVPGLFFLRSNNPLAQAHPPHPGVLHSQHQERRHQGPYQIVGQQPEKAEQCHGRQVPASPANARQNVADAAATTATASRTPAVPGCHFGCVVRRSRNGVISIAGTAGGDHCSGPSSTSPCCRGRCSTYTSSHQVSPKLNF